MGLGRRRARPCAPFQRGLHPRLLQNHNRERPRLRQPDRRPEARRPRRSARPRHDPRHRDRWCRPLRRRDHGHRRCHRRRPDRPPRRNALCRRSLCPEPGRPCRPGSWVALRPLQRPTRRLPRIPAHCRDAPAHGRRAWRRPAPLERPDRLLQRSHAGRLRPRCHHGAPELRLAPPRRLCRLRTSYAGNRPRPLRRGHRQQPRRRPLRRHRCPRHQAHRLPPFRPLRRSRGPRRHLGPPPLRRQQHRHLPRARRDSRRQRRRNRPCWWTLLSRGLRGRCPAHADPYHHHPHPRRLPRGHPRHQSRRRRGRLPSPSPELPRVRDQPLPESRSLNLITLRERLPIFVTALVLVLLTLAAGRQFDNFITLRVLMNLLADNAFLGVVAVGLTFVILTGGIDLSVGSLVGLSSIAAASLVHSAHLHPLLALTLPLLLGVALGGFQGFLIARYGLPPFLVTLAGLFLCRGLALRISGQSLQIDHPFFKALTGWSVSLPGKASLGAPTVIFLLVLVVAIWAARQTRYGRAVYAIGGNAPSARLMGLPVTRTIVLTYVLSGFCAALGGAVFTLYTSSGNAVSGTGLELDAIAAVVIGGTLLSGGYGSVFGTLLGILILGVVQTAITFQGTLSSWWSRIVVGVLLLIFMLVQKAVEAAARKAAKA
ncbi:sugar ABC transporter permease YjfF [bacterium]|nr:MAG: sugar ABC transporter permease YjfF [bacterium]